MSNPQICPPRPDGLLHDRPKRNGHVRLSPLTKNTKSKLNSRVMKYVLYKYYKYFE